MQVSDVYIFFSIIFTIISSLDGKYVLKWIIYSIQYLSNIY